MIILFKTSVIAFLNKAHIVYFSYFVGFLHYCYHALLMRMHRRGGFALQQRTSLVLSQKCVCVSVSGLSDNY